MPAFKTLDDLPEDHSHGTPDIRWAALQGLTTTDPQEK